VDVDEMPLVAEQVIRKQICETHRFVDARSVPNRREAVQAVGR